MDANGADLLKRQSDQAVQMFQQLLRSHQDLLERQSAEITHLKQENSELSRKIQELKSIISALLAGGSSVPQLPIPIQGFSAETTSAPTPVPPVSIGLSPVYKTDPAHPAFCALFAKNNINYRTASSYALFFSPVRSASFHPLRLELFVTPTHGPSTFLMIVPPAPERQSTTSLSHSSRSNPRPNVRYMNLHYPISKITVTTYCVLILPTPQPAVPSPAAMPPSYDEISLIFAGSSEGSVYIILSSYRSGYRSVDLKEIANSPSETSFLYRDTTGSTATAYNPFPQMRCIETRVIGEIPVHTGCVISAIAAPPVISDLPEEGTDNYTVAVGTSTGEVAFIGFHRKHIQNLLQKYIENIKVLYGGANKLSVEEHSQLVADAFPLKNVYDASQVLRWARNTSSQKPQPTPSSLTSLPSGLSVPTSPTPNSLTTPPTSQSSTHTPSAPSSSTLQSDGLFVATLLFTPASSRTMVIGYSTGEIVLFDFVSNTFLSSFTPRRDLFYMVMNETNDQLDNHFNTFIRLLCGNGLLKPPFSARWSALAAELGYPQIGFGSNATQSAQPVLPFSKYQPVSSAQPSQTAQYLSMPPAVVSQPPVLPSARRLRSQTDQTSNPNASDGSISSNRLSTSDSIQSSNPPLSTSCSSSLPSNPSVSSSIDVCCCYNSIAENHTSSQLKPNYDYNESDFVTQRRRKAPNHPPLDIPYYAAPVSILYDFPRKRYIVAYRCGLVAFLDDKLTTMLEYFNACSNPTPFYKNITEPDKHNPDKIRFTSDPSEHLLWKKLNQPRERNLPQIPTYMPAMSCLLSVIHSGLDDHLTTSYNFNSIRLYTINEKANLQFTVQLQHDTYPFGSVTVLSQHPVYPLLCTCGADGMIKIFTSQQIR